MNVSRLCVYTKCCYMISMLILSSKCHTYTIIVLVSVHVHVLIEPLNALGLLNIIPCTVGQIQIFAYKIMYVLGSMADLVLLSS